MTPRNPKQEGSNLWDCIPQKGPCPMNCSQCFYNRVSVCNYCAGTGKIGPSLIGGAGPDRYCPKCNGTGKVYAFYAGFDPLIPTPEEVGDGIVRMNCGHDSNLEKELVIKTAKKYKHFFFNTSIPRFDFPGPVVFTANPKEEEFVYGPGPGQMEKQVKFVGGDWYIDTIINNLDRMFNRIMFVRLRVSPTNLNLVEKGVELWTDCQIPVVLTFIAYHNQDPPGTMKPPKQDGVRQSKKIKEWDDSVRILIDRSSFGRVAYKWRIRHANYYYCPTKEFMKYVLDRMKKIGGQLVTICGTPDSNYCRDCKNCENFYFLTLRHLQEVE
jgi:hypothetical protein